jgi:hypothetical protein
MHHIRIFDREGAFQYIDHNPDDPNNDQPGDILRVPSGTKVRFKSRDGNLTITFEESPFESGNGTGTNPLQALQGKETPAETLAQQASTVTAFKYTVDVGGDEDDPEVIIDDSSGGPGKKKAAKKKVSKKKK